MNCAKMKQWLLNQVLLLLSGVFLISLYHLTVSDRLHKHSLVHKSGEDFAKASADQLDKATVETHRVKEPLIAPTAEVVHYENKASFSLPIPTHSPQSPSLNQTVVHCTTVTHEPPQETPTASPSSDKAPHIKREYPEDFFSVGDRRRGWVILHIIGVAYMFFSLLIVCDQFFVPVLGVITDKLAISDDVTGATFMAAGRSTPGLFAFLFGFSITHSIVGIGRVVGSAVFSILFVPGMCALLSRKVFHLTWWPLFRDMSFYILDLVLIIIFFLDNVIMWWESLILVISYITYLIFMKFNVKIEQAFKIQRYKSRNNTEVSLEEAKKEDAPACEGSLRDAQNDEADGDEDNNSACKHRNDNNPEKQEEKHDKPLSLKWPETRCKQVAYLLLLPITIPLWLTVPDVRNKKSRKFFVITFLSSILWINVFSYFFWWWAHQVCETIKVPHLFLTIVASPHLITSVIVTRKGLGDMAMSSCVGSNIFDITLGLPVPWLLHSAIHGLGPVAVNTDGLLCATMLLFLTLFLVIISITSCKCKINKGLGFTMFLLYVVFLVVAMMLQYRILVCPL